MQCRANGTAIGPGLVVAALFVLFTCVASRAATIQFLTPGGSSAGIAYGVDGLNVVGQDVAQRGFLYNGATTSTPPFNQERELVPHTASRETRSSVPGAKSDFCSTA